MNIKKNLALIALMTLATCASASSRVVFAFPPSQSLVELGFSLSYMNPSKAAIACYTENSIEVFNEVGNRWIKVSDETWANGKGPLGGANNLVIVGDAETSSRLANSATWAKNISTPSALNFVEIINAVNGLRPFSEKEWDFLCERHGFEIKTNEAEHISRYDANCDVKEDGDLSLMRIPTLDPVDTDEEALSYEITPVPPPPPAEVAPSTPVAVPPPPPAEVVPSAPVAMPPPPPADIAPSAPVAVPPPPDVTPSATVTRDEVEVTTIETIEEPEAEASSAKPFQLRLIKN